MSVIVVSAVRGAEIIEDIRECANIMFLDKVARNK